MESKKEALEQAVFSVVTVCIIRSFWYSVLALIAYAYAPDPLAVLLLWMCASSAIYYARHAHRTLRYESEWGRYIKDVGNLSRWRDFL